MERRYLDSVAFLGLPCPVRYARGRQLLDPIIQCQATSILLLQYLEPLYTVDTAVGDGHFP